MSLVRKRRSVLAFAIRDGLKEASPATLAAALRRSVMARVQEQLGPRAPLPGYFTGHEADGSPRKGHNHLAFSADLRRGLLLIFSPQAFRGEDGDAFMDQLEQAMEDFRYLRAGPSGLLTLEPVLLDESVDPLFAPSRVWTTVTQHRVTRHTRRKSAAEALAWDMKQECEKWGLPDPVVDVLGVVPVPGTGLEGHVRLTFRVAVPGPIVLGRTRHAGGGLFSGDA